MLSEPVVGKNFFGREDLMQLLERRVSTLKDGYRQNIAITGQSMAGKSSLLQHFLYTVRADDFIPVYVELGKDTFPHFAKKFIATLLYNALKTKGDQVTGSLDGLIERAERSFPKTAGATRHIISLIERKQFVDAYYELLGLTSIIKEETHKSCIVILDEFHNIESFEIKNPFLTFGKVIMLQKDTMYIVTSSRMSAIKKILQEKLALLFGNFEVIEMRGFDARDASRYIDLKVSPLVIEDDLKKILIGMTGGSVFYLNRLSSEAAALAENAGSGKVTRDAVEEAIYNCVYSSDGAIHRYLLNYIYDTFDTKIRDSALAVLTSIAGGFNTLKRVSRNLKVHSSEVSEILTQLSELGLISKRGVFHLIDDTMLCFWLKRVYHRKQSLLINYIVEKSRAYREDIAAYVSGFMRENEKEAITRITELFNIFSNDLIQQEDKSMVLPQFTHVGIDSFDGIKPHIVASSREKYWLCKIYEEPVLEDDIADCIRSIRSSRQKVGKFIIVPLSGIDENAKLLAKELKMLLWDIDFINTVLYAYGEYAIIRI